jgi:hypothetical protein
VSIDSLVTVFIPTSPVPSHPDTAIIERVIQSVRFHLPTAKIIVTADGIRPSVEHRRVQYTQYLENLANIIATMKYGNTMMPIFDKPTQQANMLRRMIEAHVTTPLLLFVEHDTFLVTGWNPSDENGITAPENCCYDWDGIASALLSRTINMVRFYAWERIFPEHASLMCGDLMYGRTPFVKTIQYSQWPNIARTDFYKHILDTYFSRTELKMIETTMASPVVRAPWEDFKVAIYYPAHNARRFYHLNARVGKDGKKDPGEW